MNEHSMTNDNKDNSENKDNMVSDAVSPEHKHLKGFKQKEQEFTLAAHDGEQIQPLQNSL